MRGLRDLLQMPPAYRARLIIFLVFLLLCFAGGGGSRADVLSLLYLRPAAIICIACMLLLPGRREWAKVKAPLIFLGCLAGLMLLHLIPLPPALWSSLPGRETYAQVAGLVGAPQPWRPLSLVPDLTLNGLMSLAVPLAILVGLASLSRRENSLILWVILACALFSALLGILQIGGGRGNSLYLYNITNDFAPVGLFANRNHQAALLACMLPLLVLWAGLESRDNEDRRARIYGSLMIAILLAPLILVAGSRAGLILFLAAAGLCFVQLRLAPKRGMSGTGAKRSILKWAPWAIGAIVVGLAIFLSRAASLDRLLIADISQDARLINLPVFIQIIGDFFPWGAGFGTFDPVFRIYEPSSTLDITYLNHAHNDLMELAITGGLPAMLLLAAGLCWAVVRTVKAWKGPSGDERVRLARAASSVIFLLLLASLVDYPLRTPLLAALFAIMCVWIGDGSMKSARQEQSTKDQ